MTLWAADDYAQEHGAFSWRITLCEMRRTVPTLVQDVHDGARRIERIVDDLKHFRDRADESPTALQLNEAVERALRLLAHLVKNRTDRLQVGLAQGIAVLARRCAACGQIVVNLLTNAVEALPDRKQGHRDDILRRQQALCSARGARRRCRHSAGASGTLVRSFSPPNESGGQGLVWPSPLLSSACTVADSLLIPSRAKARAPGSPFPAIARKSRVSSTCRLLERSSRSHERRFQYAGSVGG